MQALNPSPAAAALEPGRPWPLGAHWDGEGVNFAVYSAHAEAMELCLFDAGGSQETARLALGARTDDIWHGYLRGAAPGLLYGWRAHGPWRPDRGHRFNPHKLLLDPYAREIAGRFEWRDEHFGGGRQHPLHLDARDNGSCALKARVVHDEGFDWQGDRAPLRPAGETVLYELHVKSFSRRMPGVPEALRGTFAGLAHEASLAHLRRLGITAVSLLPVHYRIDEERLVRLGLSNHWGYNTLGFFAPEPRLASAGHDGAAARNEFREMVRRLHAEGIEVLLDVVYNHTAESDEYGPTLAFRGLDNAGWYRLPPEHRAHYENHTGCGNTLDVRRPRVLQLVLDSLRYWAGEMHVDGFRFDLAPVLARGDQGFDEQAAFFAAVAQDPVLARVKLIAEPWDIGPGGYQLGAFPRGWLEWNDRFRDTVRGFWLGAPATRGAFAQRLCASSDIFEPRGRAPAASVNFIVAHDGFTLRDLVSYEAKHNEANGEGNRDGHDHNLSHNCGVEGETNDPTVLALRGHLQRALLASLLLAQGTPMLCAGDELGHSQQGNNNAYCQDNTLGWIDWTRADEDLIAFTARVLQVRRALKPLANRWYTGLPGANGLPDLGWWAPDGQPLAGDAWQDGDRRVLGCLMGQPGGPVAPLLLLVNAERVPHRFVLPPGSWRALLDSTAARGETGWHGAGPAAFALAAHSLVLLASAPADPSPGAASP